MNRNIEKDFAHVLANKTASNSPYNNPAEYDSLDYEDKERLVAFIENNVKPYLTKTCGRYEITSYSLKHLFEEYYDTYITNGQMKGALLIAGVEIKSINDMNWRIPISVKFHREHFLKELCQR